MKPLRTTAKAIELDDENAQSYLRGFYDYTIDLDDKEALALYGKIVSIVPDSAYAYASRGALHMEHGSYREGH